MSNQSQTRVPASSPGDMEMAVLKDGRVVIPRLEVATGFAARFLGLMGRHRLGPRHGLYLAPCSCIHTFFMRFPLDLLFLSRDGRVVRIVSNVAPNRVVCGGRGAYGVIEMEAGMRPMDLVVGDRVSKAPPEASSP